MTQLVTIPVTGEVVDLNGSLESFVDGWNQLEDLTSQIRSVKRELTDEIARRLDHEGRRSVEIDGVRFEITAPTEKEWNMPELGGTLAELVAEGTISQDKANACIKWEPKAVWRELKTLLSDPRCAARIGHCVTEKPAARYARVTT
jgi:hypothetical protein